MITRPRAKIEKLEEIVGLKGTSRVLRAEKKSPTKKRADSRERGRKNHSLKTKKNEKIGKIKVMGKKMSNFISLEKPRGKQVPFFIYLVKVNIF